MADIRNHLQKKSWKAKKKKKIYINCDLSGFFWGFPSKYLKDFPLLNLKVLAAKFVSFSVDRIISPVFMSCRHQCEDHMLPDKSVDHLSRSFGVK